MEFSDVIKSRTSIRNYIDKEVEEEKIKYVLECARWAPSWVNKQCWRFIVVRDKETIKALSKTSIINRWLKTAPVVIVSCVILNRAVLIMILNITPLMLQLLWKTLFLRLLMLAWEVAGLVVLTRKK